MSAALIFFGNSSCAPKITGIAGTATTTTRTVASSSSAAIQFVLTPSTATPTAGSAFSVVVYVQDQSGHAVFDYTGTVHFTTTDFSGSVALPSDYIFTTSDIGSHTFTGLVLATGGSQTLTVTDTATSTYTGNSTVNVADAAVSAVSFSTQPSGSYLAGATFTTHPVVLVSDTYGNPLSGETVVLSAWTTPDCSTTAGTGTLSNNSASTDGSGAVTFSTLNYTHTQTIYLKASVGGVSRCSTGTVILNAAAASTLSYTLQPSGSVNAGVAFSTQPVLNLLDTYGNAVSGANVVLTPYTTSDCLTTPGSGSLANASVSTNASGDATFTTVSYNRAQTIYVKATAAGLSVCSSGTVVVGAAAASNITFSTMAAGNVTTGTPFTTQPVVTLHDTYGDAISGATITLTAWTTSDCSTTVGSGTLTNPTATTNASGNATFTNTSYSTAQTIYLKASGGGISVCSGLGNTVTVTTSGVASISFTTEPAGAVAAGSAFTTQPVVTVLNGSSNPVNGATVTLTAYTDSGCATTLGSGTISNSTAISNGAGVATFTTASYDKAQTIYILATSGGVSVCSGVGNTVTVAAGAASIISFTTQPAGSVAANTNFSTEPVVSLTDAYGNPISGSIITLTPWTTSDCLTTAGSGAITNASVTTAGTGLATFTTANYNKAQTIYLKATTAGLHTCSTGTVTVTAGSLDHFSVSGYPASSQCNATSSVVVTAQDVSNNTLSSYSGTIAFSAWTNAGMTVPDAGATLPSNYTFVAGDHGVHTFSGISLFTVGTTSAIKVNDTNVTTDLGSQTGITVTVRAASQLVFTTSPGGGTGAATWGTQPVVKIEDSCGNVIGSASDTIVLTIGTNAGGGTLSGTTSKPTASGIATFTDLSIDKAGTGYTLKAAGSTYSTSGVASSTFNITVGSAYQLAFTTEPSGAIAGSAFSTQPVVTVQDQGGNTVTGSSASITLAIGTNPAAGSLSGTVTKSASSGVDTFSGLSINNAGVGYTLTASSAGLTGSTSSSFNVTSGSACTGVTTIGQACPEGGIYAGTYSPNGTTYNYMTTPGGCNNSNTPVCGGGNDTTTVMIWGSMGITTGAVSTTDGKTNTATIVAADSTAAAAKFCHNMNYAGYSDWFLPARDEFDSVLYSNTTAIGGFPGTGEYWTSTEFNSSASIYEAIFTGNQPSSTKVSVILVRCVRRY